MTCANVMYQPYATYFPYQRSTASSDNLKKYNNGKLDLLDSYPGSLNLGCPPLSVSDPVSVASPDHGPPAAVTSGLNNSSLPSHQAAAIHQSAHHHGASPASSPGTRIPDTTRSTSNANLRASDSQLKPVKEECHKNTTPSPLSTQYLSANCLLLTYFNGDIASNVDEHFSRALSQPSSFNPNSQSSKSWKDSSTMSQRNFPPSFWNSSYYQQSLTSHDSLAALQHSADTYMAATSTLHGMGLHQDPWRYIPTPSASHHSYSHSMHDLAYSGVPSSRFHQSHYSSLLPTAAAGRLGAVAGQCDPLSKHADAWSQRYDALGSNLSSHHDVASHSLHAAVTGGTSWY